MDTIKNTVDRKYRGIYDIVCKRELEVQSFTDEELYRYRNTLQSKQKAFIGVTEKMIALGSILITGIAILVSLLDPEIMGDLVKSSFETSLGDPAFLKAVIVILPIAVFLTGFIYFRKDYRVYLSWTWAQWVFFGSAIILGGIYWFKLAERMQSKIQATYTLSSAQFWGSITQLFVFCIVGVSLGLLYYFYSRMETLRRNIILQCIDDELARRQQRDTSHHSEADNSKPVEAAARGGWKKGW